MQDRSLKSQTIVSPHVVQGSGGAAEHSHCASLSGYALQGKVRRLTSWLPGQKLYGMAVAFPERCSRRAMESLRVQGRTM